MSSLPVEVMVLAWSFALLGVHILLQSGLATWEFGLPYNASVRDDERKPKSRFALRAQRALDNFQETYVVFVAIALALVATRRAGPLSAEGAWMWLAARTVYLPLYLAGVPYVRTLAYAVSIWGLWKMTQQLLGWASV